MNDATRRRGKDLKPRATALTAQAAFRDRLSGFGVALLDPDWQGATARYACRCPAGHRCSVSPHKLSQGRRPCAECPASAAITAEQKFRDAVARAGGIVSGQYVDTRTPVEVTCAQGHKNTPFPTGLIQGRGICRVCAGKSPAESERRFRDLVAALGGSCPGSWTDSGSPIRCICEAGHECWPYPASVMRGQGMCRFCSRPWNAFYVVASESAVKFGITTGDPMPRLRTHASHGYRRIIRVVTDLPGSLALETEDAVKAALADARERPTRGKEYFDMSCLALILDVADSWLTLPSEPIATVTHWTQEPLFAA